MEKFKLHDSFISRHIGPDKIELKEMLETIGADSAEDVIEKTIPASIRTGKKDFIPEEPLTEYQFLRHITKVARKNKCAKSYIGAGYHPVILPSVIRRNILENPGWYTQYTPYQAEISQGRLQALLNYQTMVIDMTGLPLANASLLDEGTAAAEAMSVFWSSRKGSKKKANVFFVSEECYPQTIEVLKSRCEPLDIELRIGDFRTVELTDDIFGILVQYPSDSGEIYDYDGLFASAKEKGIYTAIASDIFALALLKSPGELGADIAVGSTQRFGIPMGYGGPHAAYFATREEFKRQMPGRIIGVSVGSNGNPALRMALQTREQHIRREKATSNICTAQVLLAIMAGMYAAYHGPTGIKAIATRMHNLANLLDLGLKKLGFNQVNENYFDTLKVVFGKDEKEQISRIRNEAEEAGINFRYFSEGAIGISISEITEPGDIEQILKIFAGAQENYFAGEEIKSLAEKVELKLPSALVRESEYLTHPVFNSYHTETEMMRYIKMLERKDLSLTHSMIPLGSCTMKLNAATELMAMQPEFMELHPFAPKEQAEGYTFLFRELERFLAEITGFNAVSLMPNSGAQGELTGLMVIRAYHHDRNEKHRNVVLIPSSAHGTNPASAVMAGGKVVIVKCDDKGNIDVDDLKTKAEKHAENLSSIMVTYPSTHGVFEEEIKEICDTVHKHGGLVYMDGANLNAQLGLTNPAVIGADVCHLNLHKTFAIPHGGGGPGMGPIAVTEALAPFLPTHPFVKTGGGKGIPAVASAPWGSASILPISYAYIKMLGAAGLTSSTEAAIINANYLREKLSPHYPVLYVGKRGFVGHELIFDTREFKRTAEVDVIDIAKRLMDYGYHAPTVSFPVPGTIMVEPTESESKAELDKFIEAMISIREEIAEIEKGNADKNDNLLKNAPHTAEAVISDNWDKPYSREQAAYPLEWVRDNKFWPAVGRVDDAYGDRNLICSCLSPEEYETITEQ